MERKDLVVLAVGAGGSRVLTPVQLQKAIFLIGKANLEGIPENLYNFKPYHYGPFDANIYQDAETLHNDGLVLRAPSREGPWIDTLITPKGLERAAELRKQLNLNTINRIREIVENVHSLSFRQLLREVYSKYPEYRANSVFQPPVN